MIYKMWWSGYRTSTLVDFTDKSAVLEQFKKELEKEMVGDLMIRTELEPKEKKGE